MARGAMSGEVTVELVDHPGSPSYVLARVSFEDGFRTTISYHYRGASPIGAEDFAGNKLEDEYIEMAIKDARASRAARRVSP
jgi:hypothetical protein